MLLVRHELRVPNNVDEEHIGYLQLNLLAHLSRHGNDCSRERRAPLPQFSGYEMMPHRAIARLPASSSFSPITTSLRFLLLASRALRLRQIKEKNPENHIN